MSRIRVDQLVNQNSSGPTLAVEGLKIPSTKNLEVDGSIILGGNTGLSGQVIARTTSGLQWASVPLTDNNTTYLVTARDGSANPTTDKVIKLLANGGTDSEIALVSGTNVNLTRDGNRITINSSFTNTNTVTKIGANGANYTDGDVSLVGSGATTITQQGRIVTVNSTDTNTTYTGVNGVTIGSDNRIQIGQPVSITDAVQFAQITVTGNLTVQGSTTYNNVTAISSTDKFINLNDVLLPADSTATGGGIILKGNTDHSILWSNTFDRWDTTEHWNLAATKEYQIGGSSVLDSTTLGPNVINSSLQTVGILSTGVWNGSTIDIAYGGTGKTTPNEALNAFLPEQAANDGKYLITDGQDSSWSAIPPTYSGWNLTDGATVATISSGQSADFRGSGSTTILLDNINRRITVDSTDTQYTYVATDGSIATEKVLRLTDSSNNIQDITIAAGTGVTLTRSSNKLTLSVAQDLSTSANPTFAALTVTGTLQAGTFDGSAAGMSGLTGATSGSYGSSDLIPVITVDGNGRISSISTSPNNGASASTPSAGGSNYHVQFNSSGGLAGNSKLQFEPSAGTLELTGTFDATTITSTQLTASDVSVSNYLKLPDKTTSERDALVVQNGTIVYNNISDTIDMYQDGEWKIVGPITLGLAKLGELQDVSNQEPTTGQVLKWSGSQWAPATDASGGAGGGGGVDLTAFSVFTLNPDTETKLVYDDSNGVFAYTPPDLSGYLTSYTESDPIFVGHAAYGITSAKITNWDAAHQWGDHSSQGYLTTLAAQNLGDLLNVSSDAPSDGQVLKWSNAQSKWAPATDIAGGGGGSTDLTSFSVSQSSVPNGNGALSYNNNTGVFTYTPAAIFDGSYLSLSNKPSLFSGNYNDLTNRPTVPTNLASITDVSTTIAGATDGQVLTWSDGDSLWIASDPTGGNEADTLDSVSGRGSQTNNVISVGALTVSNDGTLPGSVKITDHGAYSSITFRDNSSGADRGVIRSDENNLYITTTDTLKLQTHNEFSADGSVEFNKGGNGTFKINEVTISGTDGGAGHVLTTDGLGNVTFAAITSAATSSGLHDVTVNGATTSNIITVGGLDLSSANHKIRLNAANTFQIFNDGTSDQIFTSGNDLRVWTQNTNLLLGSNGGIVKVTVDASPTGDVLAQFVNGGAVELYHNGLKRFETTATGVSIPQDLNVVGTLNKNGSPFGMGDLGNVSNVTPSQGQVLKWDTNNAQWEPASDLSSSGGGGMALTDLSVTTMGAAGGGALAYNYNTGSFQFTPANVSATDTLASVTARGATTADRITVNGLDSNDTIQLGDAVELRLGSNPTTGDLVLKHTGASNFITNPQGHNLTIDGQGAGSVRAVFNQGGNVELYHTGVKKLETSLTGITVSGEITTTAGSSANWNAAHGWGNHASAGYLTSIQNLSVDGLVDVDTSTTAPTTGQILKWSGTHWVPGDEVIPPSGVEIGMIIIWSGSTSNIPTGWAICDGGTYSNQVTPDLRDRFVVGAGLGSGNGGVDIYTPGDTGGSREYNLSEAQMPQHKHSINDAGHTHTVTDTGHTHDVPSADHNHPVTITDNGHTHGVTISSESHSHGVTDYGHNHSINDPTHGHGVNESSHNHVFPGDDQLNLANGVGGWSNRTTGSFNYDAISNENSSGGQVYRTSDQATGVVVNANGTGISINSDTADIDINTDSHNHTVSVNNQSASLAVGLTAVSHGVEATDSATTQVSLVNQATGITETLNKGSGSAVDNRPPYYALCYIMKVADTSGSGGSGGGANVSTSDTAPASPADGDLWWDSNLGKLKIYYQDPDSSQWVDASPPLTQTDYIKLSDLKSVVAASSDFADFQTRIAAL